MKKITVPLQAQDVTDLKSGEEVLLSGILYTSRDQAHKRMHDAILRKERLPFDIHNAFIYYCGPAATPKGAVIGSCGPTTSRRMDVFTPVLLRAGLRGMIGKGDRSPEVVEAIKQNNAVYFLAYAGCGALLTRFVKESVPIAYKDLGPEAVFRLVVKDLPLIVGIDAAGNNIFKR